MSESVLFSSNFKKIFKLNRVISGPLIIIAIGSLLIDSVTYPGFLSKIMVVDSSQWYIIAFISILLYSVDRIFRKNSDKQKELEVLLKINYLVFPFIFLIVFFLFQLERENYSNFVFSNFHIHINTLVKVMTLSGLLFSIHLIEEFFLSKSGTLKKLKITNFMKSLNIKKTVFFLVMVLAVSSQIFKGYGRLIVYSAKTLRYSFSSFEDKKGIVFGDPYIYFNFISDNIPPESIVAVAPQSIEGIIGNIGFARYFLHPIYLFHPIEHKKNILDVDYVIVTSNLTSVEAGTFFTWPEESFPVSEGIMIDKDTKIVSTYDLDEYDSKNEIFHNKVAVLKVKK